jgi:iduronate 2-sulfatase
LVELAGLPPAQNPQPLEGRSLVPLLQKPSREIKEAVFHVFPRNRKGEGAILGRAVRTERYRLVEWKKPGAPRETAEFELYDYARDPGETKNIASSEPKVVKNLHALLLKLPEAKPQIVAPKATGRPRTDRGALFERKDANRDGHLTRKEFLASQRDPQEAPKRFDRFDANRDGMLSRDEFVHMGVMPKQ